MGADDPTLVRWLVQDMTALANLVDAADVAPFVDHDDVLAAAEQLMESLETAVYTAQHERQLNRAARAHQEMP